MDLRDAYRVLELPVGAGEDAVRDARKTLAKVWHPDRYTSDPALAARAARKLADINAAFEQIRDAKFPSSVPAPAPAPVASPAPAPAPASPPPRDPTPPPTRAAPPPPAAIEFVPRRRVRWSVIVVLAAALGAGAYFAILRLGRARSAGPPAPRDAAPVAEARPDAAVVVAPRPPADAVADAASARPPDPEMTFALGSSPDQVLAAQGEPDHVAELLGIWNYGFSTVRFAGGKVVGWWNIDRNLHVKLVPRDAAVAARARERGHYGIGATKDEVIALEGTPDHVDRVIDETWSFGLASEVSFDDAGKVKGWRDREHRLHAVR